MGIRFPSYNKYYPRDTYQILTKSQLDSNYNFFFLFNGPIISGQILLEKIKINEEIEQFKWGRKFLENIHIRRKDTINLLKSSGFHLKEFHATCQWRLIIGLGASHPQETSMTLHHTYGIPYIPGSAIKGATRYCAVLKFAEKDKKDDEGWEKAIERISRSLEEGTVLGISLDSLKFKNLIDIFGTQNQHGEVIFMDAYPLNEVNLKIDIMNPHYQNYYSGKEPPADWQNPNPIKFLTVEKTKFQFNLLSKDEDLLVKSEALLKSALKELGIGAKTAIGYGIFNIY